MPFDTDNIPDYIKKLSPEQRNKWIAVWNSTYKTCTAKGGTDCEGEAFSTANGVVISEKEAYMPDNEKTSMFSFTDLEGFVVDDSRAFDCMAEGHFTDMWGRAVEIKGKDIQAYINNSMEAIEAATTESGETVGLPIDCKGHEGGDSAGWITHVFADEIVNADGDKYKIVKAKAKWTQTGMDLIGNNSRRMFSPTLDIRQHVIVGGSLTNWPATRDDKQRVMLRPIELSQGVSTFIANVEPTKLIDPSPELEPLEPKLPEGDETMPAINMTEEELEALIAERVDTALETTVRDLVQPPATEDAEDEDVDWISLLELGKPQEEVVGAVQETILKSYESLKEKAAQQAARLIAQIKHDDEVSTFADLAIGGSPELPNGLPVPVDDLISFCNSLSYNQFEIFKSIIEDTQRAGLTSFTTVGHGADVDYGEVELPQFVQDQLDAKEISLADLKSPIMGLGDLTKYDLRKWNKDSEK